MSLLEMQQLHALALPSRCLTATLVLVSCSPPFLYLPYLTWGILFSRNYFILGLAEITVVGLGNVWSRANSKILASQIASSSPNIIAKIGRSCSEHPTAKPPPQGCALPVGPM